MSKFIFITGGVLSSLGKGVTSASIGSLLESMGYKITLQKLDPYLNVDAGTMNPYQHGEVYKKASENCDISIVEIGGTVGDIEGLPFLEAVRQLSLEVGDDNALFIHLTYVPYIKTAGELKTKPTQHSVKELREIGIQPDIIICRAEMDIPEHIKKKIALFCSVDKEAVISAPDVDYIYKIPIKLKEEGIHNIISAKLSIPCKEADVSKWKKVINILNSAKEKTRIGVVGKYVDLKDAYKSIEEALIHGGIANNLKVEIVWIDAGSYSVEDLKGERIIYPYSVYAWECN